MAVPVRLLDSRVRLPPDGCVLSGGHCQQQHLRHQGSGLSPLLMTLESSGVSVLATSGVPPRGQWLVARMAAYRDQVTRGAPHCPQLNAALPIGEMAASWVLVEPHAALPEWVTVAVHNWPLLLLAVGAAWHGEPVRKHLVVMQLAHQLAAGLVMHVKILVVRSS